MAKKKRVEEVVEMPVEEKVEEVIETPVEEKAEKKPVKGRVCNCDMLFVRSNPSTSAIPLLAISKGDEFEIDEENSTDIFYKVVGSNYGGYCMKEYVEIV